MSSHDPIPSRVRISDHPVHPMLVVFPIALLMLVPVADIVFLVNGQVFWAEAAYWLLLLGIIGGAVAAVPGLIDFVSIGRARAHREGWYHLFANLGVLSLAVVNLILRFDNPVVAVWPSGLIVSLVTAGLLMVSGWYGWELTFGRLIGVSARRQSKGEARPDLQGPPSASAEPAASPPSGRRRWRRGASPSGDSRPPAP